MITSNEVDLEITKSFCSEVSIENDFSVREGSSTGYLRE